MQVMKIKRSDKNYRLNAVWCLKGTFSDTSIIFLWHQQVKSTHEKSNIVAYSNFLLASCAQLRVLQMLHYDSKFYLVMWLCQNNQMLWNLLFLWLFIKIIILKNIQTLNFWLTLQRKYGNDTLMQFKRSDRSKDWMFWDFLKFWHETSVQMHLAEFLACYNILHLLSVRILLVSSWRNVMQILHSGIAEARKCKKCHFQQ